MQVLPHRRAVVDHRIDQVLKGEFRSLPVAGIKCGPRRETAASAFALDTDAGGIKPELTGIRMQPDKHRVNVLQRRLYCAHGRQPGPFGGKTVWQAAWRQVSVDFAYRLKRPDTESAQAQETIHGGLAKLIPSRRRRPRTQASERMAAQPAGLHVRRSNF